MLGEGSESPEEKKLRKNRENVARFRARKREQEDADAIAAGLQPKITTRGRQFGAKDKAPRKRRQASQPAPKIVQVHDSRRPDKNISTDFVILNNDNYFQSLNQLQTFGYKIDSIGPSMRTAREIVEKQKNKYQNYFSIQSRADLVSLFPRWPIVELRYPISEVREEFCMMELRKKDPEEFDPIEELRATIALLYDCFAPSLSAQCSTYEALKVAIRERDAWAFCKTLAEINSAFGRLIPSPAHKLNLKDVQERILQDSYVRLIQPNSRMPSDYIPFSNTVYGELMPLFVDRIIELTQLSSSSLFLDLGSGVGSVVAQVSLRTGCTSVGVELVPRVATLAQDLMAQILFRCHMWGVQCGHIKLEEGDMLGNKDIAKLIQHADVVLVNNHAFKPDLNEKIKTLLESIKNGAKIISLKELAPGSSGSINDRSRGCALEACRLEKYTYPEGYVSWTHSGGSFYIQTKDLT